MRYVYMRYVSVALLLFHCAKERRRGLGIRVLGFRSMRYVSVVLLVFLVLLCDGSGARKSDTGFWGLGSTQGDEQTDQKHLGD